MEIQKISANNFKPYRATRVAAYARVSTGKDSALHSAAAQISYYNEYISNHPGWAFAGVYADTGISGTKASRPEFQRMLADCRAGKIDMVITKSITRFARNTVVLLETIRELRDLDIDVFFEKENMHSISQEGDLMLTLLATYAEEEARSASENQKWRIRKKFEQGECTFTIMFGYRYDKGRLIIIDEEAEIVQEMFNDYLAGMSQAAIAKKLNEQGLKTAYGYDWTVRRIGAVLTNEKYTGDMLLQKTYVEDFRTKKQIPNRGEYTQYYVEKSHQPIVSKEIFEAVQKEMKRRQSLVNSGKRSKEGNPFTSLVVCGKCQNRYGRKNNNQGSKYEHKVWVCRTYNRKGKAYCDAKMIPEAVLINKTLEVLEMDSFSKIDPHDYFDSITVYPDRLDFRLRGGAIKSVKWELPSRRNSWTPEMREKARRRTLERRRKDDRQ